MRKRSRASSNYASAGAGNAPQEFAKHISVDLARWGKVIKSAGIKPE